MAFFSFCGSISTLRNFTQDHPGPGQLFRPLLGLIEHVVQVGISPTHHREPPHTSIAISAKNRILRTHLALADRFRV